MLKVKKVCQNLKKYEKVRQNLRKFEKVHQNLLNLLLYEKQARKMLMKLTPAYQWIDA